MWNRLLELRGSKIRKEMELKKQQRLFAVMKRKLEALQADCDSVDSQVPLYEIGLSRFIMALVQVHFALFVVSANPVAKYSPFATHAVIRSSNNDNSTSKPGRNRPGAARL